MTAELNFALFFRLFLVHKERVQGPPTAKTTAKSSAKMPQPTIIFDLDGTLIETAPDLHNCVNYLLQKDNLAPIELADMRLMIGQGAKKMIERGYAHHGISLEDDRMEELFQEFLAYYAKNISVLSKPYDGLLHQLDALKGSNHTLAVCTNKNESLARTLLSDLKMDHYFSAILGGNTLPIRKPDGLHITTTIERAGGIVSNAIMVGDSSTDIRAANNAGVPVIAVTFGYSAPDFDGFPPDATIDHYDELPHAILKLSHAKT